MGMLDLWNSSLAKGSKAEVPVPKYHEQMAVQLRRGEKAILKDNLEQVQSMIAAAGNSKGGKSGATVEELDGAD
jgi:hypothetical protein